MPECLNTKREGAVLVITLKRPAKRNALSHELLTALCSETDSFLADESLRAAVVTGAPPAFSAGLDLTEVAAAHTNETAARAYADVMYATLNSIYHAPKPIVAAVNGAAAAGGAGLMSVCDVVVAARSATIGYPEIRRGLAAAIVMPPLIRQVGERRARWLLLSGEMIAAERAYAIGLVDDVADDEKIIDRALMIAQQLSELPAESYRDTKQLISEIQSMPAGTDLDHCRDVHSRMLVSGYGQEQLKRFLEKR